MDTSSTTRSWRFQVLLWLYSNRNIAGSLLALLGPGLLFAGIIGRGWLLITLGLYALGALVAPSPPRLTREIADTLTSEQMLRALDGLIADARSQLTEGMMKHLLSIRDSVHDVLPRLGSVIASDEAYTVRATILRYLPETLASYVALPRVFRSTHQVKDGKTAQQLMTEQLSLLDDQLRQIVVSIVEGDARALLANGQFLRDRFLQKDFLSS